MLDEAEPQYGQTMSPNFPRFQSSVRLIEFGLGTILIFDFVCRQLGQNAVKFPISHHPLSNFKAEIYDNGLSAVNASTIEKENLQLLQLTLRTLHTLHTYIDIGGHHSS